ncbi:MAG: Wzz/FepE/Etk N-terminal domain-containing protein [Pseudomonadales bacterium]|nr:Wzz/FepE/Etk N-terminal domain-containing protein [Pseudomonadales bacterium]
MSERHLLNSENGQSRTVGDDEIDLRALWNELWNAKWLIVFLSLVFIALSSLYAISIPNQFKASTLLSPATTSNSNSLAGLAGQFGGLASLAGVNLNGSSSGDKTAIALYLLKTWGFLETFVHDNQLEVEVYAVTGWDSSTNSLIINEEIFNEETQKWNLSDELLDSGHTKPTGWMLFERIRNRITVDQDVKTGLVTLSVEHYSPEVAKKWVDLLVIAINDHIKQQDRRDALKSIAYLEKKIQTTSISEMRSIFYQLIEEQTKTLMLAEISDEYVLKTIGPAKIPEEKSKPNRLLIVVLGALVGGTLSILIVLFKAIAKGF